MAVREIPAVMVPIRDYILMTGEVAVIYGPNRVTKGGLVRSDSPPGRYPRVGTHGENVMLVGTEQEIRDEMVARGVTLDPRVSPEEVPA